MFKSTVNLCKKTGVFLFLTLFMYIIPCQSQDLFKCKIENDITKKAEIFVASDSKINIFITPQAEIENLSGVKLSFTCDVDASKIQNELTTELNKDNFKNVSVKQSVYQGNTTFSCTFDALNLSNELKLPITTSAVKKGKATCGLNVTISYLNGVTSKDLLELLISDPPGLPGIPLIFSTIQASVLDNNPNNNGDDLTIFGYLNLSAPANITIDPAKFSLTIKVPFYTVDQGDKVAEETPASFGNKSQVNLSVDQNIGTYSNFFNNPPTITPDELPRFGYSNIIFTSKATIFSKDQMLRISLKGLNVSGTEGPVIVYVHVDGVTGYAATDFELQINKSNIVEKDGKVSVGPSISNAGHLNPNFKFQVSGRSYFENEGRWATEAVLQARGNTVLDGNLAIGLCCPNFDSLFKSEKLFVSGNSYLDGQVGIGRTTYNQNYIFQVLGNSLFSGNVSSSGDLKVGGSIKDASGYVMPKGGIIMWSGPANQPPEGWALCDGNNGTPDLRDRFVLGAGGRYQVKQTGGSEGVTLTKAQLPNEGVTFSGNTDNDGAHSHNLDIRAGASDAGRCCAMIDGGDKISKSGGEHSHHFSGKTDPLGSGQSITIIPQYYALAYIMKL